MEAYQTFLKKKERYNTPSGFDAGLNVAHLFPFQNFVVNRALQYGRYGVFSGTGTGKTRMEIMWCNEIVSHTGRPTLILCPLAVANQTIMEAEKIGDIEVRRIDAATVLQPGTYICNYDQLENIAHLIPGFAGVALDEASILKNHEGAYRNLIIDLFRRTAYKSVWTATPSPNTPMEIGNYSEFLGIMRRDEMLSMFFTHDSGSTSNWRLRGHAVAKFWQWVNTWAVMFEKPHDIGFPMDGFDLPPLNFVERQIVTETREGKLFNDVAVSATNFNWELRITKVSRLEEVVKIIGNSDEQFLIWVKQNEEGAELKKLLPGAIEVKGSDKLEWKEGRLFDFANGEIKTLITKAKIAGMGLNFQSCHNQVFPSLDFSFEGLFQSIRRSWRYGQTHTVNIFIITTDTMQNVIHSIRKKEKQHQEMVSQMIKYFNNGQYNQAA